MNELELSIKEEIKKLIEYIFEPIKGELVSFEKPYDINNTDHTFSGERKSKVTFYPIIINTKLGKLKMDIKSDDLNNPRSAIGVAFGNCAFIEGSKLLNEISVEIEKRIYS